MNSLMTSDVQRGLGMKELRNLKDLTIHDVQARLQFPRRIRYTYRLVILTDCAPNTLAHRLPLKHVRSIGDLGMRAVPKLSGMKVGGSILRRAAFCRKAEAPHSDGAISSRRVFNLNTIRTSWQRKSLHKRFIKVMIKPMCGNFPWPDRIQFEHYTG